MSAHTPGPWVPFFVDWNEWKINAPNGDPTIGHSSWQGLAVVYGCDEVRTGPQVAEANARLISAAPDLLAHLQFAVKLLSGLPAIGGTAQVEAMRAAIAKTTGKAA